MPERRTLVGWASLGLAALVLHLALVQPNHPEAVTWAALRFGPHELPLLLVLLATAPLWVRRPLRLAIVAFLLGMVVVKLADLGTQAAYLRTFNPAFDLPLLYAGWEMSEGAIGRTATQAMLLGLLAALVGVAAALWWATGRITRLEPPRPAAVLLLPALALLVLALGLPGAPFTLRLAWERAGEIRQARLNLADFRTEAARDPWAAGPSETRLAGLHGHDILLMFVESYGRTALDNPRYAPTIRTTLAEAEPHLAAAGLAARSAFLVSPVVGGQSWLAHATLLSGLDIDNQGRFRALVNSPRQTLVGLAADAGWHTAAIVPAITRAWPEADYSRYRTVLAADDLGYRGRPFNWVTMPDQFTLAAFERRLLDPAPRAPVFAEIALISSHAPWTPIPPRLDWDNVGDGSVFAPYAMLGDPPSVVWRDADRVRDQFRQALAYTLATALDFTARRGADAPVVVLVGDHQPAGFVNEGFGGNAVPIHVVGPPDLLARLDAWGWTAGLVPDDAAPVWPMQDFRDAFLAAFAAPQAACGEELQASGSEPLPNAPSC
jgi:hypothetical protein